MMTFEPLLRCEPHLDVVLTLCVCQALFWFIFTEVFTRYCVQAFVLRKLPSWMREQWIGLQQKKFNQSYGIPCTRDEAFTLGCFLVSMIPQHFLGGALCIPSVYMWWSQGCGEQPLPALSSMSSVQEATAAAAAGAVATCASPSSAAFFAEVAAPLARHGMLCELGWEVQDSLRRAAQVSCGGEAGRAQNPKALLLLLVLHHILGSVAVVPAILRYPNCAAIHEGVMLLEGAATCGPCSCLPFCA